MKEFKIIVPIMLLLLFNELPLAQNKVEKEEQIKDNEVPEAVRKNMIILFGQDFKGKWYKELSDGGISIEAKLKHKGSLYSVEFSEGGEIEDIEIELNWNKFNGSSKSEIKNYFSGNYEKVKVKKIQKQITGNIEALSFAIHKGSFDGVTLKYEIEYLGLKEGKSRLWEGLFTDNGELIKTRLVVLPSTDNLDF